MTESTVSEVETVKLLHTAADCLMEASYYYRTRKGLIHVVQTEECAGQLRQMATLLSTIKATGGGPSREEVARAIHRQFTLRDDGIAGSWELDTPERRALYLSGADAVLSLFSSEGKEDHGLSRDHDPTTCIALEALKNAVNAMELQAGRMSGSYHISADAMSSIWTVALEEARAVLSSQTQVAGEGSRDVPKPVSQPDHAPGEGGAA